jgi:hypothetical protein
MRAITRRVDSRIEGDQVPCIVMGPVEETPEPATHVDSRSSFATTSICSSLRPVATVRA